MKANQLNLGQAKRVMYVENKQGLIDGFDACIGWVSFSKTGKTIYYKGKVFTSNGRNGVLGNYLDADTGEEYWISGVKKEGSNAHPCESLHSLAIDEDAQEEYYRIRGK